MLTAELILALLIAVAALVTIARRIGVAYPIFLLIGGLALGLIPGIPRLEISPDVIFLIVLPPILYAAAYFTPLRSLRANLGTISSLAVALVLATAAAVAVAARALIPSMTWPFALVLGAIVAPPDAIAATAIASRLSVPPRVITILEGESLLNDATALTLYSIALTTAFGSAFSGFAAVVTFTGAIAGGGAIGLAVAWVIAQIRSRLQDTPVEITISLLTPYAAFLPADRIGASGVIAAVTAGLYLGHRGSQMMGADARLTGQAVWNTLIFLLNGFVFIVMGLEVPLLIATLPSAIAVRLVGIGLIVCLALVGVRMLFIFSTVFLPEFLRSRRNLRDLAASSVVLSWAGMRGVVSLAAVLALPLTMPGGGPFPAREALLIVTLTVIVFTLLGQGLTLPPLIRRLGLCGELEAHEDEARARQQLVEAATRRLDQLYPVWPDHRPLLDQLRDMYRHRSEHIDPQRPHPASSDGEDRELIEHREIRRTVIDSERKALMRLRAEGEISDEILRTLERELDFEEQRMDA